MLTFHLEWQTVNKKINTKYWELINEFKQITGSGMVINTSFNVRGEPIVCTPNDAYRCFMSTDIDYLVIENFLYKKRKNNWTGKIKRNGKLILNQINTNLNSKNAK